MEDRFMLNNSQGKKQEVEDHSRIDKFCKNKTSVTACNDCLNAKTSNVNFICATCGKCVLNEKHDMCVLKSHNGVNSKTKIPIAVPVSTREPKRTVKQSVVKSLRKTATLESNQKLRNTTRKLYEHVSKECSWWYPKFTPPEYKWKPKSQIGNVNLNVSMPLGNASRTVNILEPMTPRRSTMSKTTLHSNSFAARRDCPIHHRLWVLKAHDGKSQASNYFFAETSWYEPSMVAEDDEMSKDKEIDILMDLISLSFNKIYKPTNNNLRTSSNTSRANQDNSLRINIGIGYESQRIGNVVGDRETVDQELEAHYMYMAQIQKVSPDDADNSGSIFDSEPLQKDTYPIEQNEHNVIIDSLDMSYDREKINQNDDDDDDDLSSEQLDRRNDVEYASKMEIDCAKAKGDLISYKIESQKSFNKYTQQINDLKQTISEMKKELSAHQETISILS
nr:hypothetical protein [Tanacetum cinerariifolium]